MASSSGYMVHGFEGTGVCGYRSTGYEVHSFSLTAKSVEIKHLENSTMLPVSYSW